MYLLMKYLHILSATLMFGTGLGTAFYMWVANRSRNVQAMAVVGRNVVRADFIFTTPAVIAQPITGLYMALTAGYPVKAGWHLSDWNWLGATFLLYAVAGVAWLPVVWYQMRMHKLAEAAARANVQVPAVYWEYERYWTLLGFPGFGSLVVVYWLMVFKPF